MTVVQEVVARARERLDRRMTWLRTPCECGHERRVHLAGREMCAGCPCPTFRDPR